MAKKTIKGKKYTSKNHGDFTIISDKMEGNKYKIKFKKTGFETITTKSNINKRTVKDYLTRTAHEHGYLGTKPMKEDKEIRKVWQDLIKRAYGKKYIAKYGTYENVSISPEWLDFRNFRDFYKDNFVAGYQLDKDLIKPGNKVYSAKYCVYLPQKLNKMIMSVQNDPIRNDLGVTVKGKRFLASIKANGKVKHLSVFDTEKEAHHEYMTAKIKQIETVYALYKQDLNGKGKKGMQALIKRLKKHIK